MKKKPQPRPVSLTFPGGRKATLSAGESVLNAAWRTGIALEAPCGGQGWCGHCRVHIDPAPAPSPEDGETLSPGDIAAGWRLACRTHPAQDSTVFPGSLEGSISSPPVPRRPPPSRGASRRPAGYGIALDIGTTTLAAQLWDTAGPSLLGTATLLNPQAAFGLDVISRISSSEKPGSLTRLQRSLRRGVNDLLRGLLKEHGVRPGQITEVVAAGNTTMEHFLAGADPSSLARAPFRPSFLALPPGRAPDIGLHSFSRAAVHFIPNVSAFIGGDAVAGVLAVLPPAKERPALLIDMGTNAEMVLIRSRTFLATSAAAGPALEGGALASGLRAVPGAIEEVDFTGDLLLKTIGDRSPRGLCGSGLIDLVAVLIRLGFILSDGRLLSPEEGRNSPWKRLVPRLRLQGKERSFVLSRARGRSPAVILTQDDIRQVQLAKAAIATGWQLLLREARLDPGDVSSIFLAGSFGYSLRPRNLSTLGLIPALWEEKLSFPGNTSLAGATRFLLSLSERDRLERIIPRVKTRHLAETNQFRDCFVKNLDFP